MARGKYAARAGKRQVEAAYEHLDRVTDQLAEAKLRARQVQRDAAALPHVRAKLEALERKMAEDTVVAELVDRINRDREAINRLNEMVGDLQKALMDALRDLNWKVLHLPGNDMAEYVCKRWPALYGKEAGREEVCHRGVDFAAARRLSDEAIRRIQVVRGERVVTPEGAQPMADRLVDTFTHPLVEDQEVSVDAATPIRHGAVLVTADSTPPRFLP